MVCGECQALKALGCTRASDGPRALQRTSTDHTSSITARAGAYASAVSTRSAGTGTKRPPPARAAQGLPARARLAAGAPGLIIPPPLGVTLLRGEITFTPTVPIPATVWNAASCLGRARLQISTSLPVGTARGWATALTIFQAFLAFNKTSWQDVDAAVLADFVVWRVVLPAGTPKPPPGFNERVELETAMEYVGRLRAYVLITEIADVKRFYGPALTAISKRLSSGGRDSVRKTPVNVEEVDAIVSAALTSDSLDALRDAAAVTTAFFFFLRGGELDFLTKSVQVTASDVTVVFTHQKNRGGIAKTVLSRPVSRICAAPTLLRVMAAYLAAKRKAGLPTDMFFEGYDSSARLRETLYRLLGRPEVLPGETLPLPWSCRAGAATYAFMAGMSKDRIMRLGRWKSEVALTYAVLTPRVQAVCWLQAFRAQWWNE